MDEELTFWIEERLSDAVLPGIGANIGAHATRLIQAGGNLVKYSGACKFLKHLLEY